MKGILKFLAFICALLLVISLPLALLAFDIGLAVFNPPVVKRILTEEATQSNLLPAALEWFSDRRAQERIDTGEALTGYEPDIVQLMSYLDSSDWAKIKSEVLTNEILADWVSASVDGVYAWIDNQEPVPSVTWQMQAFKDRVNSEHGINSITIAYENLPPCDDAQLKDFQTRLAALPPGTKMLYNLCKFPQPWHDDQFNQFMGALEDVVKSIPPQFALTQELSNTADTQGVGPEKIKSQLRLIRLLMNLGLLIPLVLLLLIMAFAIRSLPGLGRWWGVPLLVGGFVALLPTLVYRGLITSLLASGPLSEVPELIKTEATRAVLRLAAAAFQPLMIQAIIIMVVALVLVILAPRFQKKEPEA